MKNEVKLFWVDDGIIYAAETLPNAVQQYLSDSQIEFEDYGYPAGELNENAYMGIVQVEGHEGYHPKVLKAVAEEIYLDHIHKACFVSTTEV